MILIIEGNADWISISEASKVQSLVFDKDKYDVKSAKEWADKHGFKNSKVDEKPYSIRLRQKAPSKFKNFRTKEFGGGIKAILGFS